MRKKYYRLNSVSYFVGELVSNFSYFLLVPLIIVFLYRQEPNEGLMTTLSFIFSALLAFVVGTLLKKIFRDNKIDGTASMLICGLGWIFISALGAIPYVLI